MSEKVMRSVRANPEIFDRLGKMAKDGGLDQGAALEALLNAWDVQQAKGQVPERAADVADFDAHLQGIQRAFLRSLELAQSAEDRAASQFRAALEARDATIIRLQADLASAKAERDAFREEMETFKAERDAARRELDDLRKRDRLAGLLESLTERLDAPTLEEAKPRKGRKAKAAQTPADTEPEYPAG